MTESSTDDRGAARGGPLRTLWDAVVRFVGDALVLTLWVVFLTLVFLETAWPRWAFYGLLLGGVAVYVSITVPWIRGRSTSGR
ncbi:hypothetical protein D8Y22_02435 [Salinadaptatus halalkaliphilus]|uniref:DUF8119 domain-containing protein n=1 Tax=Salinadaptatus halalkaliphilus TaxID=2419781 RepID=A0A4V3VLP4_9EURY|nr:hypothetical protein [Salinadaptatus halalkaliphilus]THE66437.1 hypothetical protein D8Y22_02435 [Salinadaptatus halalkaliphilus]